jgi:hypothetical protein
LFQFAAFSPFTYSLSLFFCQDNKSSFFTSKSGKFGGMILTNKKGLAQHEQTLVKQWRAIRYYYRNFLADIPEELITGIQAVAD